MRSIRRVTAFIAAAVVVLGPATARGVGQSARPCSAFPVAAEGWQRSYRAGCEDPQGKLLAGSEMLHLVAGAYNNFLPVRDPATNELVHVICLEAFVAESPVGRSEKIPTAPNQRRETGGFYAGALYAVRSSKGEYRIREVDGPPTPSKPALVSARTYAVSPFPEDGGSAIYFAGYDADWFPASDTAWIFRTDLATALRRELPQRER